VAQKEALECCEASLADNGEPVFSLPLRLDQRVTGREIVGGQRAASISRANDFTDPAREIEGTR
jgi:hypothetical protein